MRVVRPMFALAVAAGLSTAVVSTARATDDPPLITKRNQSGFTIAEAVFQETCTVYSDHVTIVRRFGVGGPGSFEQRERRPIQLTRGVRAAIRLALEEEVEETENLVCDTPTTTTVIGPLNSGNVIFETGGCGEPRRQRLGPHSGNLQTVVDAYCPVTHDIPPDSGPTRAN